MKAVRVLLFAGAAVLLLVAVVVAVAFTSGFQTWVAHKVLAGKPELRASVGRVDAGLGHVHVEQFRIAQAGATLTLPTLDVDLPVVSAASHKVQVGKLVAKGWTIDLTAPAGSPANPAPPAAAVDVAAVPAQTVGAAFQGVFSQLKLPVDLSLDAVELEGEVILPVSAGQPPARVHVTLTGGQLGAGREGKFTFSAATTLAPTLAVNALNAGGTLVAAMDTPRTFSRLAAHIEAEARGPQFPQGTKLSASFTAGHANAGESYTVVVETAGRKLLGLQADYPAAGDRPAGTNPLKGAWMVDLTDDDLAPFTLGRPLPDFVAKGEGKLEAGATLATFSASGRFDLSADKLGTVRPELDAFGAVKAALSFDLTHDADTVRVASLALEISGTRPVLAVRALQPFSFNVRTRVPAADDPAKDLLSVDLQGVPLAWAQPFAPGFTVTGTDLRGAFAVGVRTAGTAALRATEPLVLGNLALAQAGQPLLRGVDLSLRLSADYTAQGWQAELAEATVRSGGATLLTLAAKAGQLAGDDEPLKATGQWTANLPALLQQPAAGGLLALTGGRAAGDFAVSLGAKREIQAKLAFTGLAVDPKISSAPLPSLNASLRADIAKDGRTVLNLPLSIERNGRKSDLTLDGTLSHAAGGLAISGRVTSSFLAAEDAQALSLPLAAKAPAPAPASPAAPSSAAPDAQPFWNGLSGEISLALKKVSYQQSFEATDVGGTLRLDAGAIKLDGARAGLGEGSDLKLNGGVTFDAKSREPYALKADLAVNNFNSAALFKAINPGKTATIDGKFNVVSQLTATAPNSTLLAERAHGDFQLTSKGGTCRLLEADLSDKLQKTQSTVATLGGLLAAATGREKV
ncbi:MAG TPA: AsmA family protein, partial [Opitutaceae bacterium]|nr:AsmA family protein [Opitutaceae bacterium]